MPRTFKVLVTGATGTQGGAIARLLRERGHHVRGLTRKAQSPAAQALAGKGIEIAIGQLEDRASLDQALKGVDSVLAVTTPYEAGTEAETRQGVTVADAAQAAGAHLVFNSVASADKRTGIPHFESKYEVEKHIRAIGARATILAPVYFMENAITFTREQIKAGVYATPLPPDRKLAQIAVADIAAAAVAAIENPDRFAGRRLDLAGDEVSGGEAVRILSRVTGRTFAYFQVPMDVIRQGMGDDGVKMYEWFDRAGYAVDMAALRRDFPDASWHSFEAWARQQDWPAIFGS
jgi:uncharacterized protein YbjT (DUF2867 family)